MNGLINACRLCLSETDFNVSLFGSYCQKSNMLEKIAVCLRLSIQEQEYLNTICYRCAENVERYYDFINNIKKAQSHLGNKTNLSHFNIKTNHLNHNAISNVQVKPNIQVNNHLYMASHVNEPVNESADYTFSFLDLSSFKNRAEKIKKASSPLFSDYSQANLLMDSIKKPEKESVKWKTPSLQSKRYDLMSSLEADAHKQPSLTSYKKKCSKRKNISRDIFESQDDEVEPQVDWKLTPDMNIIRRVRNKVFGNSDF